MEPSQKPKSSQISKTPAKNRRDFLLHLEAYLAKRDGVDKLLKICRYAAKIAVASANLPPTHNLKVFESSVGVSRKAFRLGKFVQDINALRGSSFDSAGDLLLNLLAYGGEGLYYFVEQFVWLGKAGLIDKKNLKNLQKISALCEFVGYIGSVSLKIRDLRRIAEDEACSISIIEISVIRNIPCVEEEEKLRKLREKKVMKRLSVLQDFADALMALADIRDGRGVFSGDLIISSAGLLSALISTHKNWVSC